VAEDRELRRNMLQTPSQRQDKCGCGAAVVGMTAAIVAVHALAEERRLGTKKYRELIERRLEELGDMCPAQFLKTTYAVKDFKEQPTSHDELARVFSALRTELSGCFAEASRQMQERKGA
jgi:hypothetical protein